MAIAMREDKPDRPKSVKSPPPKLAEGPKSSGQAVDITDMVQCERRTRDRLTLLRPCKVYVPRIGRYLHGSTWNVSPSGALIELDRPAPLEPGDRLFVGVAITRRQAIFASGDMRGAGILRVLPTDNDCIAVAIHFDHEEPELSPEMRRAA